MSAGTAALEPEWHRLDPRMLLVHPIKELVKFLPVLLGLLIAGGFTDGPWALIGVGVPVTLGVVRYLTTTYRVTATTVELRRGLLDRHSLSTPVDRVRTVDLTASPIHRLLGLTTVRIGTGTGGKDKDDALDLDGLTAERARALRHRLLHSIAPAEAEASTSGVRAVVSFDPSWLRGMKLDPAQLSVIQVMGDSMAPTLSDGDDILVNLSDGAAGLRDGIYVLRLDGALNVKRLIVDRARGRVSVKSDNPAYTSWPTLDLSRLDVIGRVVWAGRRLR